MAHTRYVCYLTTENGCLCISWSIGSAARLSLFPGDKFTLTLYADDVIISLPQRPLMSHQFQVFFLSHTLPSVCSCARSDNLLRITNSSTKAKKKNPLHRWKPNHKNLRSNYNSAFSNSELPNLSAKCEQSPCTPD